MTTRRLSAVAPPTQAVDPLASIRRPDGSLPLFIKTTQLATLMEIDRRTVYAGIDAGTIKAVRIGNAIRIPLAPFLALSGLDHAPEVAAG
jgi:excisionase family DNA binding protein